MQSRSGMLWGLALAGVLGGVFMYVRTKDQGNVRQHFIDECRQFGQFPEHETLFLAVIAENHDAAYKRHAKRQGSWRASMRTLDWDGYRGEMYGSLVRALVEAGDDETAVELDRFRSSVRTRAP